MRVLWLTAFVIVVDQATKFTVLRTMHRGESIPVLGDWLKLTFTENPGMAFGITVGPPGMVTMFSIIATFLIILYMIRVRDGYGPYLASLGLILGGALGNIIDRVFYGAWIYDGSLFTGRVVDFIHVSLWNGYLDLPFMEPRFVALFPIWNVADMAIVGGVIGVLVFQHRFHERLAAQHAAAAGGETPAPDAPVDGTPTPPAAEPAPQERRATGTGEA